ncbi:MAG: hypothetical protein L3J04_06720 [Robiginitomaculum sp.]|nr:hypothetical protein [Robiginitomaculum sp.]
MRISKLQEVWQEFLGSKSNFEEKIYYIGRRQFSSNLKLNISLSEDTLFDRISNKAADAYVNRLKVFLHGNHVVDNELRPILHLTGWTGSGKTTTLKYISDQVTSENLTQIAWIGFNNEDSSLKPINVWVELSSQLEQAFPIEENDGPANEVTKFWKWCLSKPIFRPKFPEFSDILDQFRHEITALSDSDWVWPGSSTREQAMDVVLQARNTYFGRASAIDRTFYKLALLLYNWEIQNDGKKHVLLVDDIDHLNLNTQREIINAAMKVAEFLNIRLIIAFRPMTWETTQGHSMQETEEHLSPYPLAIIAKYLKFLADSNQTEQDKEELINLANFLQQGNNVLSDFISGSSGLNVRAGIRTFSNFLISPVISEYSLTDLSSKNIAPSKIGQAFFISSGETIAEGPFVNNFENLYEVEGILGGGSPLLKTRILDCLVRIHKGSLPMSNLIDFLCFFGYPRNEILIALKRLFVRKRALIWSNQVWETEDPITTVSIGAAPMGCSYYQGLFGNYGFIEAIKKENRAITVPVGQVIEFSKSLIDTDMNEIQIFIDNASKREYLSFYAPSFPCLTYKYWTNFYGHAHARIKSSSASSVSLDPNWEDDMKSRVAGLLST